MNSIIGAMNKEAIDPNKTVITGKPLVEVTGVAAAPPKQDVSSSGERIQKVGIPPERVQKLIDFIRGM